MDQTLTAGTRLGPYEIEGLLAAGGMGQVYRARDPRLDRLVAIKTLPASMVSDDLLARRFDTEARTAGGLDHPNLLTVYDTGRAGDVPYIVTELLDGETLRARLQRQGAFQARQVVELASGIVAGLAAAHARGIAHRDLKPENLFLTRDRRLKILDFGIAKRIPLPGAGTLGTAAESLTATGAVVGTVGYMAPEQLLGESVDMRADLFSLGAVLHELLGGTPPFRRDSALATMTAAANEEPPALPATVPPALARIVRRCLEKSPDDRFQSAHDVAIALEYASVDDSSETARIGRAGNMPASSISRRTILGQGVAAAAIAATAFAGGLYVHERPALVPSYRRLTFRRGLVRSARASADGKSILYGALVDGGDCRVHMTRVDSPESRPLDLPPANLLAISRAGELAIAVGMHQLGVITYGTLARVPITGGAPREMIENVKFADWSPDGAELAIVRRVGAYDRLEYPIGKALVQSKDGEPTGVGFARVSPDGRHVAFVQYRTVDSLTGRVCLVDSSGTVTPITPEYIHIHGLAWRGDEVLFTAGDDRPLFRALHAVTRGTPRIISRVPGNATLWDALPDGQLLLAQTDDRAALVTRGAGDTTDRDLSWLDASWIADISRDGTQLLFSEAGQGGGPDGGAYLRPNDGAPAVRLASGQALALSPDGRWALCGAGNAAGRGASPYIELVPTRAGEVRRIIGNGLMFVSARWTPDVDRVIVAVMEPGRAQRLCRLDLRSERPEPFTPEGVIAWVLSPDGRFVAFTGAGRALTVQPVDGAPARVVQGTTGAEDLLAWVVGGVLVSSPDAPGDVRLIDVLTGRQTPWAMILPQDRVGVMVLSSFAVTPDGATRACSWHRALSDLYLADGLA